MTVWDIIIRNKEDSHIKLEQQKMKYNFVDLKKEMRDAKVRLYLFYDIMPYVGQIKGKTIRGSAITFPSEYK